MSLRFDVKRFIFFAWFVNDNIYYYFDLSIFVSGMKQKCADTHFKHFFQYSVCKITKY